MSIYKSFAVTVSLILLGVVLTSSVPLSDIDCKSMLVQLRELYNYLLANGELRALHELVRKDGRVPSLRLRFGKRSNADWRDVATSYTIKDNYMN